MKTIFFALSLIIISHAYGQFGIMPIKKDTLSIQKPVEKQPPVDLKPVGMTVKESLFLHSDGNLVISPRTIELFSSNDISHFLTVSFRPEYTGTKKVIWFSENPQIASVGPAGQVFGLKHGNTRVAAVTENGSDTAFCMVQVNNPNVWGNMIDASGRIAVQGNTIFFCGENGLSSMDFKGNSVKLISSECGSNLQVVGRWIYYEGPEGLTRVDLEGKMRKVIDSRMTLLRVHASGDLYCHENFQKVYKINMNDLNKPMEMLFEEKDEVRYLTLNQYYLFYGKSWENSSIENGGVYRYAWATEKKENVVPITHKILRFAIEEGSSIVYYFQYGGSYVRQDLLEYATGEQAQQISVGMYTTPSNHNSAKKIPQLTDYLNISEYLHSFIALGQDWNLVNDWVYYFNFEGSLYRVKAEGKENQFITSIAKNKDCEIDAYGNYLFLSCNDGSITRMLLDGRDPVVIR